MSNFQRLCSPTVGKSIKKSLISQHWKEQSKSKKKLEWDIWRYFQTVWCMLPIMIFFLFDFVKNKIRCFHKQNNFGTLFQEKNANYDRENWTWRIFDSIPMGNDYNYFVFCFAPILTGEKGNYVWSFHSILRMTSWSSIRGSSSLASQKIIEHLQCKKWFCSSADNTVFFGYYTSSKCAPSLIIALRHIVGEHIVFGALLLLFWAQRPLLISSIKKPLCVFDFNFPFRLQCNYSSLPLKHISSDLCGFGTENSAKLISECIFFIQKKKYLASFFNWDSRRLFGVTWCKSKKSNDNISHLSFNYYLEWYSSAYFSSRKRIFSCFL